MVAHAAMRRASLSILRKSVAAPNALDACTRSAPKRAAVRQPLPGILAGRRRLIQPHHARPPNIIDQLTGRPVRATFDGLGAELPNVDVSRAFSSDELETLKQACDDAGGILVLPNQRPTMTLHDHVRFARQLAASDGTTIEPHAVAAGHADAPQVLEIVRDRGAKVIFGENWHSDNSFLPRSSSYSILRGVAVPRVGVNDTLFSSTEAAFDALSSSMQRQLLELNAYHSANRAYGRGHSGNSRAAMEDTSSMALNDAAPVLATDVLQPVVTVHPRTGRRNLFVSPTFTSRIEGMRADESAALLAYLYAWIARPEFCTRVSWRPHQVVLWDNRSTSHKGLADEVGERRVVQRVSIRGTAAPVNHRGESFALTHQVQASAAGLF